MNFKQWLEDYKSLDPEQEYEKVRGMNMTAALPMANKVPPLNQIQTLTRGFHLNTIVGRMMTIWTSGLLHAPVNWDLIETDPEKAYQYRVGGTKDPNGKAANSRYQSAYDLFKQELANAVGALPFKQGMRNDESPRRCFGPHESLFGSLSNG